MARAKSGADPAAVSVAAGPATSSITVSREGTTGTPHGGASRGAQQWRQGVIGHKTKAADTRGRGVRGEACFDLVDAPAVLAGEPQFDVRILPGHLGEGIEQ